MASVAVAERVSWKVVGDEATERAENGVGRPKSCRF